MNNKRQWWKRKRNYGFRVWDGNKFVNDATIDHEGNANVNGLVQYCTMMKDVNGAFIYEGDVVETDEGGWIGVVCFGVDGFYVRDSGGGYSSWCNWNAFKVLGNVFNYNLGKI